MELEIALGLVGGVARWSDLVASGVPASALRRAHPHVRRAAPGVFALEGADPARVSATIYRAQVGCVSACLQWGLPLIARPERFHLIVPRGRSSSRRRCATDVTLHRSDRHALAALHAEPLAAIDQAGRCTSPVGQVALLDAAIARGLVAPGDAAGLTVGPAHRRRWVAEHVDARAESIMETVARCGLVIAGVDVEPQVWMGRATRVDFVARGEVVVETDGAQHFDPRALAYDRKRDRGIVMQGMPVMRFGYSEVMPTPALLVTDVCAALGCAPRPGWKDELGWALAVPRRR